MDAGLLYLTEKIYNPIFFNALIEHKVVIHVFLSGIEKRENQHARVFIFWKVWLLQSHIVYPSTIHGKTFFRLIVWCSVASTLKVHDNL